MTRVTLAAPLAGLVTSCTLLSGVGDLRSRDADARAPDGGGAQGDGAAPGPPDGGTILETTASVVVPDGDVDYPAGAGPQRHVHYATHAGAWIVFAITRASPTRIQAFRSADWRSWQLVGDVSLLEEHGNDGRSFDVAYADRGRDVFHVTTSLRGSGQARRHFHVRGVLEGPSLAFSQTTELASSNVPDGRLDPDAPAIAVLDDGRVLDCTGWYDPGGNVVGNASAFVSAGADDGASFSPSFGAGAQLEIVAQIVNARAAVPVGGGALSFWESANSEPRADTLRYARLSGTTWSPAGSAPFAKQPFDGADWSAARGPGDVVHVVRWSSRYEHAVFDGTAWSAGAAVPDAVQREGDGVVVVTRGASVHMFAIDRDSHAVRATTLVDGGWGAWREILPGGPDRRRLTGNGGANGAALLWEEGEGLAGAFVPL